jgi:hypothetical protein
MLSWLFLAYNFEMMFQVKSCLLPENKLWIGACYIYERESSDSLCCYYISAVELKTLCFDGQLSWIQAQGPSPSCLYLWFSMAAAWRCGRSAVMSKPTNHQEGALALKFSLRTPAENPWGLISFRILPPFPWKVPGFCGARILWETSLLFFSWQNADLFLFKPEPNYWLI